MDRSTTEEIQRAFTLKEFCARNRLCLTKYYSLKKEGIGPREMDLGGMIRISAEAEADWKRAREMPGDAELRLIRREQEARQRKARKAAQASVASQHHVSKRRKCASVGG